MQNPLSISTGYIYRLLKDNDPEFTNKAIKKLKGFKIDGVELCLITKERLDNFKPSEETMNFIKSLKFNTIHAPVINFKFKKDEQSRKVLERIEELYKELKANNVVFHNNVEEFKQVLKFDFKASIENDEYGEFYTINHAKEVLEKYPDLYFMFDLAHGYEAFKESSLDFIDEFKDRMIQCHISKLDQRNHWFLHKSNAIELMKDFKRRIPKKVILVNETVVWQEEQIPMFAQEIDFLRKL